MKDALHIPYAFVLMNWAAIIGLYCFLRRESDGWQAIWTTPLHSQPHSAYDHPVEKRPLWVTLRQLN